ncbi:HAD family hydrolase [Helicobacter jaachi]|uniref:phosphoglycolate phosphatase n=1 Tax=Helicobacter jaachi TaxID=1677920 RepID=A0A4U8TEQ8_9HELI|nr:HAD family hydrolase [Helicobacter jaachi]
MFLFPVDSINLFAGSIDMLKRLNEQFRLCIISASEEQIVKSILQKHNALTYFAHLYCGNTPKSETLKKYADKDSIMIGDGISDMQAAKIAQVYGIGVLWGWQDKDMLIESSVLVENHAQLLEAIFRFYAARFYKI